MNTDWLGLGGRIAVVTGAAGGIGRAVAASFVEAGVSVMLLDRDAEALHAIEHSLRDTGGTVAAMVCDIGSEGSIADAARATQDRLGPVDILVNNAGILRPGPLATLPLEEWNTLLTVNLTGYLLCAQAFRPQMLGRGGAIVSIASIAASNPQPRSGAYSPSKAAVAMLSRQWRWNGARTASAATSSRPDWCARRCRRLSTRHQASPRNAPPWCRCVASPRRRTWRMRCCSCAARVPATSPAPRSWWMAGWTRW
ncbi:SDR family NAD(P)-dependent oxidoreductase [Siccirubricoccus deserti]